MSERDQGLRAPVGSTGAGGYHEQVLRALGEGDRTFRVAKRLRWSTAKARYYLTDLEKVGLVHRCARYTADNDIYWLPGEG